MFSTDEIKLNTDFSYSYYEQIIIELKKRYQIINSIKDLKNIQREKNIDFDIEIDGGINFENSKIAIEAGANILVSVTTVFKSNNGDIKKNIDLLKSL